MLRLLHSPCWDGPDARPAVPTTVPGALLLCLAAHDDGRGAWIDRETLVVRFWPDRPAAEGQRNLRANLHRLRSLLSDWGCAHALVAERTRLRLALPTDLALLAAAAAGADPTGLLAHAPLHWLQGYRLPGFAEFRAWADDTGSHWQSVWRTACAPALEQTPGDEAAHVRASLLEAWQQAGGADHAPRHAKPRHVALDDYQLLPGRGDDQARLRSHGAAVVVVLGEPGIGKTSLLTSAWPAAPLLKGRQGLEGVPFAPVLEWLRQHPAWLDAALRAPQAALGAYRLDLARLLPEIARDEALPPLDAQTAKARLLEALARLFESRGPVLLVDDLQWLDLATLEWLVLLAHRGQLRWRGSARRHELAGAARQPLDSLQAARLLHFQALDGACPTSAWPKPAAPVGRSEIGRPRCCRACSGPVPATLSCWVSCWPSVPMPPLRAARRSRCLPACSTWWSSACASSRRRCAWPSRPPPCCLHRPARTCWARCARGWTPPHWPRPATRPSLPAFLSRKAPPCSVAMT